MLVQLINTIFNALYNAFIGGFQFGAQITTITTFITNTLNTFMPYITNAYSFVKVYMADITLTLVLAFLTIDIAYYAIVGVLGIIKFVKSYIPVA